MKAELVSRDGYDLQGHVNAMRRAEMAAGAFIAGYSRPRTREAFSLDMRQWLNFLTEFFRDIDPIKDVRRGHVDTFMRQMEARDLKPATVNRRVGTVCLWYRWLHAEEYIDRDPTINVKRPKTPRESTRDYLSRRELADWVTQAELEGGYPYALACLLAFNGLRISEALNLTVSDLSMDRYHHTLSISGKGDQPDIIGVPARTVAAIRKALDGRLEGPLLLNRYGNAMTRPNAAVLVARLARKAKIGKNVTPHSIRHSAITALLEAGQDISAAADFARHLDTKTTQRYDRRRRKLDQSGSYLISNFIAEAEA